MPEESGAAFSSKRRAPISWHSMTMKDGNSVLRVLWNVPGSFIDTPIQMELSKDHEKLNKTSFLYVTVDKL